MAIGHLFKLKVQLKFSIFVLCHDMTSVTISEVEEIVETMIFVHD